MRGLGLVSLQLGVGGTNSLDHSTQDVGPEAATFNHCKTVRGPSLEKREEKGPSCTSNGGVPLSFFADYKGGCGGEPWIEPLPLC